MLTELKSSADLASRTVSEPANTEVSTPVTLDQIIVRVRRNASEQPAAYLKETEVPHGGE